MTENTTTGTGNRPRPPTNLVDPDADKDVLKKTFADLREKAKDGSISDADLDAAEAQLRPAVGRVGDVIDPDFMPPNPTSPDAIPADMPGEVLPPQK